MMKLVASLALVVAVVLSSSVSAFTARSLTLTPPSITPPSTTTTTPTRRHMFSADDAPPTTTAPAKGLSEVSSDEANKDAEMTSMESTSSEEEKNYYKDMNTGEIKEVAWTDPAMAANTNPFNIGWAYAFVIFPAILLLNDAFHFLPDEGPLSYLKIF